MSNPSNKALKKRRDQVTQFVIERARKMPHAYTSAPSIHAAYQAWCQSKNQTIACESPRAFYAQLCKLGWQTVTGNSTWNFVGYVFDGIPYDVIET